MGSYVPSTPAQRQEMLEAIGLHDFRQLYRDVPEEMLLRDGLDLPEGMSELEVSRTMTAMAARNTAYSAILRGAGAYDHYIPSLVKYVPAKEEFLTAAARIPGVYVPSLYEVSYHGDGTVAAGRVSASLLVVMSVFRRWREGPTVGRALSSTY